MTTLPRLDDATLDLLPPTVGRPAYDRQAARPGIVHLGLGAFHRAHQAVFADDALGRGDAGWGIVAASLRSSDTRDALASQSNLYSFVLRDGDTTRLRVIGSILRTIVAPEEPEALVAAIADPGIRLITLTVTEKGYGIDRASGRLDRSDAGIRADLAGTAPPVTALGFLAAGFDRRRRAGAPRLTVVSCDNLPKNGEMLRAVLAEFADLRDPALGRYIRDDVAFASSMVDRIVPATTAEDRAAVDEALGLHDAWPVIAEPAFAWVIEDRFPGGRPPFESSGVRFVADVEPYEHMKLRLLNGAHTAIAAIGRLAGLDTVPEAVAHPAVRRFLDRFWDEMEPTLAIDPEVSAAYRAALLPRFANAALPHRTAQIATDASLKVPQRLLAPLQERLARQQGVDALIFAIAVFLRSCDGIDDGGRPFALNDPAWAAWREGRPDTVGAEPGLDALAADYIFGADLPKREDFLSPLRLALDALSRKGALATLAERFP